jgi:hypothetical protein
MDVSPPPPHPAASSSPATAPKAARSAPRELKIAVFMAESSLNLQTPHCSE